MHILWAPSWFPSAAHPENGSFFAEQLKMFNKRNFQCGVIVVEPSSFWEKKTSFSIDNADIPVIRAGLRMIPKGLIPIEGWILSKITIKCARVYEERYGKPDIIHAHSVWPGIIVARILADYWNIPYILTEHRPSSFEIIKQSNRGLLIHNAMSKRSCAIGVSTGISHILKEHYILKEVRTIALPVKDDFFSVPLRINNTDNFTFIHISNLDDNKRTIFTIDTFGKHYSQYPNSRLLVVGGSNERVSQLRSYVNELGLTNAVHFSGHVDRDSIIATFSQADCLILVSAVESAGAVFAEAAAMGKPAIASNTLGGSFMVTNETGIIIPIDNEEELLKAMAQIQQMLCMKQLDAKTIRKIALTRFSESVFVDAHNLIYSECIESHPVNR